MNVFELITPEDLDEAPEDPPRAFTYLVTKAQRRLAARIDSLTDSDSSYVFEEARHGFMNVTLALARSYGIEPFASMEMPKVKNFSFEVHNQFKADLDHYLTQLLVSNSKSSKSESVELAPKIKDRIRSYIHGLKTCIDDSDFTDSKKQNLLKKIAEFEQTLEKNRLSFLAVTKITFVILSVPGTLWGSHEAVTKLTTNILQLVGEAKATEDEERQIPEAPPVALLPPRKEEKTPKKTGDLDDEIPF